MSPILHVQGDQFPNNQVGALSGDDFLSCEDYVTDLFLNLFSIFLDFVEIV